MSVQLQNKQKIKIDVITTHWKLQTKLSLPDSCDVPLETYVDNDCNHRT